MKRIDLEDRLLSIPESHTMARHRGIDLGELAIKILG